MSEFQNLAAKQEKKIFMCSSCHRIFEEKSRYCPRCETRTMGELRPRK